MAIYSESTLVTRVRRMADMVGSSFVTDAEIRDYLNSGISELHDVLVQKYEDYYVTAHSPYTLSSGSTHSLPDDFYKALGVDLESGGQTYSLRNYSFAERNMYKSDPLHGLDPNAGTRYHIQGSEVKFIPDNATGSATLYYVPAAAQLNGTNITSITSVIPGYEEYIVVCAAVFCLMKEESDVQFHLLKKNELLGRIESAAGKRNAGDSYSIVDVGLGSHSVSRL